MIPRYMNKKNNRFLFVFSSEFLFLKCWWLWMDRLQYLTPLLHVCYSLQTLTSDNVCKARWLVSSYFFSPLIMKFFFISLKKIHYIYIIKEIGKYFCDLLASLASHFFRKHFKTWLTFPQGIIYFYNKLYVMWKTSLKI